jgi:hypothetical protein
MEVFRQKMVFSLRNRGVSKSGVCHTLRKPEENGMRAGGKYSENREFPAKKRLRPKAYRRTKETVNSPIATGRLNEQRTQRGKIEI